MGSHLESSGSSSRRGLRTLLLLARYGRPEEANRKLGFIEYDDRIKVNRSLISVGLHD